MHNKQQHFTRREESVDTLHVEYSKQNTQIILHTSVGITNNVLN